MTDESVPGSRYVRHRQRVILSPDPAKDEGALGLSVVQDLQWPLALTFYLEGVEQGKGY